MRAAASRRKSGLKILPTEFNAVLDDALAALGKNQIGQREQEEVVLSAFSGMRSQGVLV
jgi:hemoglobin